MPIINSILSWLRLKRISQIDLFKKYPVEVQQEMFVKLIEKSKETKWGEFFDYKSIKNVDEYRERIPIQNYDSLKPYIDRIRKGEKNVLWPGETKWFAKSSGTTSDKSKFIPVSRAALEDCHFRGGKDVLTIYGSHYPETNILKGKGLIVGGSHQINNFSNDSYYGDLSAVLLQNLPS